MTLDINGSRSAEDETVLTPRAQALLELLHTELEDERQRLLAERKRRAERITAGEDFDFDPATASVREASWTVAPAAPGLDDRRVEITGPTDRRMTVNALNSGAKVWLADFEDAITPTWRNVVDGQVNLYDAIRRQVDFTTDAGRRYELAQDVATIVVRPRGLHLDEAHVRVGEDPVAGAFFDFAIYFAANAEALLQQGSGPYFYLPKLESGEEARLWNRAFVLAQDALGIPQGTIRATVLIETLPAAFQMEEILYELRDHAAGLNAGRWDYMFSLIKYYRSRGADWVLPDRNTVTMTVPFMRAYTRLLVRTCHRRGAHAIGGMSAFIPNRRDPEVNNAALEKVRADKHREAGDGFDGSWVAHPDLVAICREEFSALLGSQPNQKAVIPDVSITAADLLAVADTPGEVTRDGLLSNISVGVRYLEAWLEGTGAVAIDNLMEDAATAEIARSQVWQWIHNSVQMADGETVTADLVNRLLDEQQARSQSPSAAPARELFEKVAVDADYVEFLTLAAYPSLVEPSALAVA
ncbi:malate synthase A [Kineococcus radiotolerans]|uniref:Malate synthase n=1 Tax=Kineococcus radiotolerans (strain ATCC BAA-149 / DSM 14245 / SRS30216) TaxID=266940 RepID=A6WA69_KINRD|nr:malate synthase A [Kineococcus radiotolerans]ABS03708.1 malate synthase A [Kineococcus radiotolerans SRS30216 = ATCC BAA-149]